MWERLIDRISNSIRTSPYFFQKSFFSLSNDREFNKWEKSGKPSPPPRKIKEAQINKYREANHYLIFIETGTYKGDMVFAQLKNFNTIYSIELNYRLWKMSSYRFRKYPHISIIQGDSGKALNQVIEKLDEPAIFWLDGHYSGGITSLGEKETPILEELRIIFQKDLTHVILIDDARLFNGTEGYPTIEELKKYIYRFRPDCDIKISDDCIQVILKRLT